MRIVDRPGPAGARTETATVGAPGPTIGPGSVGERPGTDRTAAAALGPLIVHLLGGRIPVAFAFWDGSTIAPAPAHATVSAVVRIHTVDAVRRMAWAPGELGLARAFVAGDIEIDGDIVSTLRALADVAPRDRDEVVTALRALPAAARAALALGAWRPPPPPPVEEVRPRGRLHSVGRDAQVVRHHYDVGNDFYELVLGPAMTYSCARFPRGGSSLEEAQVAKHELICRKLGLAERPGARLLDVGCGWGSMALHAATGHGARVVGVTVSEAQADYARRRVTAAGLDDRIEIRLQDYRRLGGERFDAVSSVGMFEHVGAARMARYFGTLRALLGPGGRLLNHAISSPGGSRIGGRSFIGRYVFPDGELQDVGRVVLAMEDAGFEVRDVESLREHYSRTLRAWVANLESRWLEAVALVGAARARVWRLYMAGSAVGFDDGGISVHQVLAVVPGPDGASSMPATRDGWVV